MHDQRVPDGEDQQQEPADPHEDPRPELEPTDGPSTSKGLLVRVGGIERVNFGFVALRWQSPFWRTWDWLLLSLALVHGINGLRVITLDYVRPPGWRFALTMAYYVIGFTLMVLGTVIVVTFDPMRWGPVG